MKYNEIPAISVIIVTYNGLKWMDPCLSPLSDSTIVPHIIVIDNGSTDGTVEKIKTDFKEVELIESPENLGFGCANNLGMKIAVERGDDYVFLLNQDAWVEKDTLEKLIDIHNQHPEYGILSPVHVNASYTRIDYNFSNYIVPKFCPDLYSDMYLKKLKDIYTCDFVNAAAWLIPTACIKTVGLFDSIFFHYGEDRNYAQRVLYHQFKIGVCPNLTIIHDRERKGVAKEYQGIKERKRDYLVKLANINNENYINDYIKLEINHLYSFIKALIFFNKKDMAFYGELFNFLRQKKKEIDKSRTKNKMPYVS